MQIIKSEHQSLGILLLVSAALLFFALGGRELWSLETRWANIVLQMLQSGDYFNPFLKGELYSDKPLLSYWIIVLVSKIAGVFSAWTLRIPSALSALMSVYFIYAIGYQLFDKKTGLLAGWLLTTTFYFIFWGRVASADMLNTVGVLAAVWWYLRAPERTTFFNYVIFFQIIALTSLCKGLLGVILPGLIIVPHLIFYKLWKRHLNTKILFAILPALLIYFAPFYYQTEGLQLVVKENIIRFIAPFDHKGAFYIYFLYLPLYLLPWAPLFLIALVQSLRHWKSVSLNTKWLVTVIILLFIFFTASGSRRSYYILPLVPFAQLLTAVWLAQWIIKKPTRELWLKRATVSFAVIFFVFFGFLLPGYYAGGGLVEFGKDVKEQAQKQAPWKEWQVVMVDVDNKIPFYIQPILPIHYIKEPTELELYDIPKANRTIIISRTKHKGLLQFFSNNYRVIESTPTFGEKLFSKKSKPAVAFIPITGKD